MLRFILFLSIACNVLFIGAVTAYIFRNPVVVRVLPPALRPPIPDGDREHALLRAAETLPALTSDRVSRALRAMHTDIRGARSEIDALKHRIKDLLAEHPLPVPAIRAAHTQMQKRRAEMSERFIDGLINISDMLTPDERARFIAAALPDKSKRSNADKGKRRASTSRPDSSPMLKRLHPEALNDDVLPHTTAEDGGMTLMPNTPEMNLSSSPLSVSLP